MTLATQDAKGRFTGSIAGQPVDHRRRLACDLCGYDFFHAQGTKRPKRCPYCGPTTWTNITGEN